MRFWVILCICIVGFSSIHSYEVTSNLGQRYLSKVGLLSPELNTVVKEPTLLVKGVNRYLLPVVINGELVIPREDGRFYHNFTVPTSDTKLKIWVSFLLPNKEVVTLERNLLNLRNKRGTVHTDFLSAGQKVTGNVYFTRADLAYFLCRLIDQSPTLSARFNPIKPESDELPDVFEDVSRTHWAAESIERAVAYQFLAEYPDGLFRPEAPVKKMEYILAIANLYRLDQSNTLKTAKQTDYSDWRTKYLAGVLKEKWIPVQTSSNMEDPLTWTESVEWVPLLPDVKKKADIFWGFDGFEMAPQRAKAHWAIVTKYLDAKPSYTQIAKKEEQKTDELKKQDIQAKTEKSLGSTEYEIQLKKHWIYETAKTLQEKGVLSFKDELDPNGPLTVAEAIHNLVLLHSEKKIKVKRSKLKGVDIPEPYLNSCLVAITKGWVNNEKEVKFNEFLTRKEALTLIFKSRNASLIKTKKVKTVLFKDVPQKTPFFPYVWTAYQNKWISGSKEFFPARDMTRAQFWSILLKLKHDK